MSIEDYGKPVPRNRAKFIPFNVVLPITKVVKKGELFTTEKVGAITLEGKGRIESSRDKIDILDAITGGITIELTMADYNGVNLLDLLNLLPAGRPLRSSLEEYAKAQVIMIHNSQLLL